MVRADAERCGIDAATALERGRKVKHIIFFSTLDIVLAGRKRQVEHQRVLALHADVFRKINHQVRKPAGHFGLVVPICRRLERADFRNNRDREPEICGPGRFPAQPRFYLLVPVIFTDGARSHHFGVDKSSAHAGADPFDLCAGAA